MTTQRKTAGLVTHYNMTHDPNGVRFPKCRNRRPMLRMTKNPEEVTCNKCRAALGLPALVG
jgi:hypothetical protein